MLTECDVLSRYNMATSEWYDTTTANDTDVIEPTVPAAVLAARVLPTIASIFDPIELEDNRKPTSWYSLPSIMRIGHPTWPSSNIATMATSQERVILVTGAATVPIDHALDLLGVDGTILRFDTGIPNEYANRLRLARQNHFFANLHTLEGSRIDWFLAVYTDQPSDDGKPDQRLNNWFETSLNQALALIQAVNLKAAMIMCPIVFPSAARIAHSRVTAPSGWQFRIITLRNTYHGGSIETDHEVFLLLRDDAANAFSLPIITSTPGAMNEIIDIDPDPQTFLWLNDLSVKPAPEIIERRDEHDQSAHTVKLVKLRSEAKPFDGWNTFCPSRPGPSIARPRPEETFFSAPFALWIQPVPKIDPSNPNATLEPPIKYLSPACRPISLNEIFQLLGLEEETIAACRLIPRDILLTHARSTPGSHGLSALFRHIALSEINTEESDTPGMYAAMPEDTLSLIRLPTDDEWRQATLEDHDLNRILNAFKNQRELLPRELDNNEYAIVIKNERIEVIDGISITLNGQDHLDFANFEQKLYLLVSATLSSSRATVLLSLATLAFHALSSVYKHVSGGPDLSATLPMAFEAACIAILQMQHHTKISRFSTLSHATFRSTSYFSIFGRLVVCPTNTERSKYSPASIA